MKEFSITITTFSKRFAYISNLISQIRSFVDNKIYLIVNGEKNGLFDEEYRVKILSLCASYKFVYPTIFTEIRGLAKLWNTAIINSDIEDILILNDDLEIYSDNIFKDVSQHILKTDYKGLTKINGSFSHFVINKNLIQKIGFFDERLLGFGEEDGDVTLRLLKLNVHIQNIFCENVTNIVSPVRHEEIKPGLGKYSSFNREFIMTQKYKHNPSSPHQGMFDYPVEQILEDINPYPLEDFFTQNKHKLFQ